MSKINCKLVFSLFVLSSSCIHRTDGFKNYTCTSTYEFTDHIEEDSYSGSMDCDSYAEAGFQMLNGDNQSCEDRGYEEGAIFAVCNCNFTGGTHCNPSSVND